MRPLMLMRFFGQLLTATIIGIALFSSAVWLIGHFTPIMRTRTDVLGFILQMLIALILYWLRSFEDDDMPASTDKEAQP